MCVPQSSSLEHTKTFTLNSHLPFSLLHWLFSSNYILTLLISPNKPQDITCLGLCTCSYLCFKFFHLSTELQMPFKTHFTHQLFHEGVFESPLPTSSLGSRAGQWLWVSFVFTFPASSLPSFANSTPLFVHKAWVGLIPSPPPPGNGWLSLKSQFRGRGGAQGWARDSPGPQKTSLSTSARAAEKEAPCFSWGCSLADKAGGRLWPMWKEPVRGKQEREGEREF